MNYSPEALIDKLLAENVPRFSPGYFAGKDRSLWEETFRGALRDTLGIPPFSRRIENIETLSRKEEKLYSHEEFLVRGEADFPLTLLTPSGEHDSGMTILALNGHGPGVSAMTGEYRPEECHHSYGRTLAEAGFTVVMPEIIGFGRCRLEEDRQSPGDNSCRTLALKLLPLGYSLTGLRLWQLLVTLDLMERQFWLGRLGCFGFSGGGHQAYLLTALDGRISALGLAGYCSTFGESILKQTHCPDNYIPGLLTLTDQPEIAHLVAPRPLYIEAGLNDRVFPFKGAQIAMERMGACYDQAGCGDRFVTYVPEGGHEIQGRDMIRWYKEVLG